MDARGGARRCGSCWRACGTRHTRELDRRARRSTHRGGRAHRAVAIPAVRAGAVRASAAAGSPVADPVAWRSARAVLRLHVALETRRAVCANGLVGRMDVIDAEVLATLGDDILRPSVVERAVALALEELQPWATAARQGQLESELAALDAEYDELMAPCGGAVTWRSSLDSSAVCRRVQARRQTLTTTRPSASTIARQAVPDGA